MLSRAAVLLAGLLFAAGLFLACPAEDKKNETDTLESDSGAVGAEDVMAEEDTGTSEEIVPEEDGGEPQEEVADEELAGADETPPEVTMNLVPYTAVQGELELDASWTDHSGVALVQLVVDGAVAEGFDPGTRKVDTTSWTPGLHEVGLHVEDSFGNATDVVAVPVVTAGTGTFLEFYDGWAAPSIPGWAGFLVSSPGGAIYDQKSHIQMPAGMGKVTSFLRWKSETTWNMGLDIGTGNCPDSGTKLAGADLESDDGFLWVEKEGDGIELPTGTWFSHVRFIDGDQHGGEAQQFDALFLVIPAD